VGIKGIAGIKQNVSQQNHHREADIHASHGRFIASPCMTIAWRVGQVARSSVGFLFSIDAFSLSG
jgi:hypothetical protein